MSGAFSIGVPLGAVTAVKIVNSDSAILDLGAAIVGGAIGGMAADVLWTTWAWQEARRREAAKCELGPV